MLPWWVSAGATSILLTCNPSVERRVSTNPSGRAAIANNITVFGPEVNALPGRYLMQMLDDIRALPDPDGVADSLLASIELIVPHQANKTMVIDLAEAAGLSPDQLYFKSSGEHLLGEHSAGHSRRGPRRSDHHADPVFAPGFGAGRLWAMRFAESILRSSRPTTRRHQLASLSRFPSQSTCPPGPRRRRLPSRNDLIRLVASVVPAGLGQRDRRSVVRV